MTVIENAITADVGDVLSPVEIRKRPRPRLGSSEKRQARKKQQKRSDALIDSILPRLSTGSTPNQNLKSDVTESITNRWLELYDERQAANRPVVRSEFTTAPLRSFFPIIYVVNNKDIADDDNWAPCLLSKIRKEQFEMLDTNGEQKVDADVEWEGDEGLQNTWSMYHKYPSQEYVEAYRKKLQMTVQDKVAIDETPRRQAL